LPRGGAPGSKGEDPKKTPGPEKKNEKKREKVVGSVVVLREKKKNGESKNPRVTE